MSPAITLSDEIAELRAQRKAELIDEAMRAEGPFWNLDPHDDGCWDGEQDRAVFKLVKLILAMPTIKPETRWLLLEASLRKGEVERYAEIWTQP